MRAGRPCFKINPTALKQRLNQPSWIQKLQINIPIVFLACCKSTGLNSLYLMSAQSIIPVPKGQREHTDLLLTASEFGIRFLAVPMPCSCSNLRQTWTATIEPIVMITDAAYLQWFSDIVILIFWYASSPLLPQRRLGPLHVVDVRLEELAVAVVQLGVLPLHLGLLLVQAGNWTNSNKVEN